MTQKRERDELNLRQLLEPDHQEVVCAHFGCGIHLTLLEQLCGKMCTKHNVQKNNYDHQTLNLLLCTIQ